VSGAQPVAHKPTAALVEALRSAGWTLTARNFPGHELLSHPLSGIDLPTPEYMRGNPAWPFDTYFKLRQLSMIYDGSKASAVWARECAAPWVQATERHISFRRAIEYVKEEWAP
jgi:hypothetical protein